MSDMHYIFGHYIIEFNMKHLHENLWLDPKFNIFVMYTVHSMAFYRLADMPRRPYWIRYVM